MAGYGQLACDDGARRALLLASALNGIDYLEVSAETWAAQLFLHVHFVKTPPPAGLVGNPGAFSLAGGVRERGLRVVDVTLDGQHLVVEVDRPGDFSTYTLSIEHADLDPAFRSIDFSFKAGCPSRFDCRPREDCPPPEGPEPPIDYMARDYASFRRALLDLVPSLVPDWTDRHEADLGMALVELLAYTGDHLSYQLDAVSNELHLEAARQRVSVRRHARLIDYRMHDGASARTFVFFWVADDTPPGAAIPAGTRVYPRIDVPLDTAMPPHGPVLAADRAERADETADAQAVFETLAERPDGVPVFPEHNEIALHPWGDRECCLPKGATTVDLFGDLSGSLAEGDFLLFEEVKGPATGSAADADPTHRQVVRLIEVATAQDPLADDPVTGMPPLPVTRVTWSPADALAFPLCLSARLDDGTEVADVSVARGNLVLADHGLTIVEGPPEVPHAGPPAAAPPGRRLVHRLRLRRGPLSFRAVPEIAEGAPLPAAAELRETDPQGTMPQVSLAIAGSPDPWEPARHLLDAGRFDELFAVETDNRGRAWLRFGDGELGRLPPAEAAITATYRIGIGNAGNIGHDALAHVAVPLVPPAGPPVDLGFVAAVRNPVAGWGGIEPEPMERVRQLAPPAMHAEQFRAVTEADYKAAAEKHPEVDRAVATFRWTGSWYTVFITVDRCGGREVDAAFESELRDHLEASRLAGYDLEIDPPVYVPLEIEIDVCAHPHHFRAHVAEALAEALSARDLPGGRRGFFHPDGFTFGEPLFLSRLYAAVEAVPGVDSAEVTVFKRWYEVAQGELDRGFISFGRYEIPRLDNEPNFPENGVLRITVRGGK